MEKLLKNSCKDQLQTDISQLQHTSPTDQYVRRLWADLINRLFAKMGCGLKSNKSKNLALNDVLDDAFEQTQIAIVEPQNLCLPGIRSRNMYSSLPSGKDKFSDT